LGAPSEAYVLEVLDGVLVKRTVATGSSSYLYTAADQTADFGAPPPLLQLRVAQLDAAGATGLKTELTITL
jgi:hypothetical protein